jgi:membrane protein implicated in regulation of membrane protease activity
VDPVPRLTGHHVTTWGIALELGAIVLVAALLGLVWWRGRRRRSTRPSATMRDDDSTTG